MTKPGPASLLDDAKRARLAAIADVLIAGSPGWPSASAADLHGEWIDRAFAARPDLAETITAVLAISGEPRDVVTGLQADDPVMFESFSHAIAGTYLMIPKIRNQLGLPSGAPEQNPAYPDEAEFYLEDGLLDPVIARGSIFRGTPRG